MQNLTMHIFSFFFFFCFCLVRLLHHLQWNLSTKSNYSRGNGPQRIKPLMFSTIMTLSFLLIAFHDTSKYIYASVCVCVRNPPETIIWLELQFHCVVIVVSVSCFGDFTHAIRHRECVKWSTRFSHFRSLDITVPMHILHLSLEDFPSVKT